MGVTIRLFAALKDLVGGQEIAVQTRDGATAGELEEVLAQKYRLLKPVPARLGSVVNL